MRATPETLASSARSLARDVYLIAFLWYICIIVSVGSVQVKVLSVLLTLLNDSKTMETAAGCGAKDGINFDVNSTSCARAAPIEATGLAYNSFARGAVAMSTIFLGPALLKLAEEAATSNNNCNYDEDNHYGNDDDIDSNCIRGGGRIYGMKPTSLLTNIGVFSGLISSVFTPLFGALVDHTNHRKTVGQISSIILSVVKGIEIFINQSTWFLVSVLQVVNFVVYNAYLCAVYAYTAELSNDPNEQTNYNSRFQSIYYVSMLMFLVLVMVTSTVFGTGDVGTARISQTVAFIVCSSVFIFSWKYFFRERPALRQIPPGSTLVRAGFNKLSYTCQHIWTNWYSLRFFLLSVSLSESATAALSTIATTYMTSVLEMQASDIGKVFFCVFVAGIPGSKLGGKIGVALNPLRSALLCLVVFIINTTIASHVLKGPDDKNAMYIFAAVWGICISWLHPAHVSLYSTIIPRGQETELMGLYIFAGSVIAWLPPLLFSLLNEVGVSMNFGLASLNLFFAGAFVLLLFIGKYEDAVILSQDEGMIWTSLNHDREVARKISTTLT